MTSARIRVRVDDYGRVRARAFDASLDSDTGLVQLAGLDGELVGHFERWLTLRDREWTRDEIRSFGQLLHRCLFPRQDGVWTWVQQRIDKSPGEPVRLTLQLPTGRGSAYMSAIPWEYLHTPDPNGYFLALHDSIVLSRWSPGTVPHGGSTAGWPALDVVTILPVVSDPSPQRLGPVEADEVLETLAGIGGDPRLRVLPTINNHGIDRFRAAVLDARPDVVHFMGHGRFNTETGVGSLALVSTDGQTFVWAPAEEIAGAFCPPGHTPRAVVLHTCDGGKVDTTYRFAGLAPELISRGVQCVIAMQYPIRNDIAQRFSRTLYEQLSVGRQLDEAVQRCRIALADSPRLIGLPVLYQSRADPLTASSGQESSP